MIFGQLTAITLSCRRCHTCSHADIASLGRNFRNLDQEVLPRSTARLFGNADDVRPAQTVVSVVKVASTVVGLTSRSNAMR